MTPLEILDAMDVLLTPVARWCHRGEARDAAGALANPHGDTAVCWCLLGALRRLEGMDRDAGAVVSEALRRALPREWKRNLTAWHDHKDRTHDHVMKLLRDAQAILVGLCGVA